jgi:hypothetical protein
MARRTIAWVKEEWIGAEFTDVTIEDGRLSATGIAIGSAPVAYRLDYELTTVEGFVTSRLLVATRGEGWSRRLDLRRPGSGMWTVEGSMTGFLALPKAGGDAEALAEALDCDLGLSPLTNTMPVLRHGLLEGGGPVDLVMAWVSVPDLAVLANRQRYAFVGKEQNSSVIRYQSLDGDFAADITFDRDGLVVDYPGIGRRGD